LWRNQVTRAKAIEATSAVVNVAISNPGTTFEVPQRRRTLIRNAAIPKVRSEIGSAMSCKIGLIKVLTTPIATAATIAVHKFASLNPGTRYSTIKSAKTLIASLIKRFISLFCQIFIEKVKTAGDRQVPGGV